MQRIQARKLLKGLWEQAPEDLMLTGVVTDNREATPGCVFVAIKGENTDGHKFALSAVEKGAAVVVAQHLAEGVSPEITVLVNDPLDAMITMGQNYRNCYSPKVIGVTGSVGKTTTKEFCAAVFSAFGKTLKNEGNQNNEIGLPKTLFNLTEDTRYAVLEMGMQGLGEIHKLSVAAKPHAALITKIGTAHMEQLGSVENIRKAKMEICDGMAPGSPLILNGDDEMQRTADIPQGILPVYTGIENAACDVQATNLQTEGGSTRFTIQDKQYGAFEVVIPTIGRHNVGDALQAYAAATRLGLDAAKAAKALEGYVPADMRQIVSTFKEVTLIEDCYNANPDSMQAALRTLQDKDVKGRRIAVLGDMRELGTFETEAHRRLGKQCAGYGVDILITVGKPAALAAETAAENGVQAHACETNQQAAQLLIEKTKAGDTLLIKASRALYFEEIIKAFKEGF